MTTTSARWHHQTYGEIEGFHFLYPMFTSLYNLLYFGRGLREEEAIIIYILVSTTATTIWGDWHIALSRRPGETVNFIFIPASRGNPIQHREVSSCHVRG